MKKLITLITLILIAGFVFGQTEKTLVKTFNLQGNTSVVLNLNGNVIVEEWGESTLRVHMNITLETTNVNMLKYLITQGRYNLLLAITDTSAILSSPGRDKDVIVNKVGDVLSEEVSYTVFVPRNIQVEILNKEDVEQETAQNGEEK
jgi:hypothetical protein